MIFDIVFDWQFILKMTSKQ